MTKQPKILTYLCLMVLGVCLLMMSCARPTTRISKDSSLGKSSKQTKDDFNTRNIEQSIRKEYQQWKGTRHVLGGNNRNGVDCSGFVRAVYQNVFKIELPRSTKKQAKVGTYIERRELKAGDLVFFKPPSAPRHVGIYLSRNQFVHASKSNGVTISKIDRLYWGKYYWTGRRILRH